MITPDTRKPTTASNKKDLIDAIKRWDGLLNEDWAIKWADMMSKIQLLAEAESATKDAHGMHRSLQKSFQMAPLRSKFYSFPWPIQSSILFKLCEVH